MSNRNPVPGASSCHPLPRPGVRADLDALHLSVDAASRSSRPLGSAFEWGSTLLRTVEPSEDILIYTRPIPLASRDGRRIEDILIAKSVPVGECVLWTGSFCADGYGRVSINGQSYLAHRVAYTVDRGAIPDGLSLDHFVCKNRACIRPAHLEPVTAQENCRRKMKATETHCPNGHAWSDGNLRTYTRTNGRVDLFCRTCERIQKRASRAASRSV